jgi:S-adenosyl methyltransferase
VFSVRANRAFLARTVRFLAAEEGIRQFLDIGTGIPANSNTHQVAQGVAPEARIVYVDNDPIVLSHARALLTSKPEGACAYIDADVHDPDNILASAADTLDFGQPPRGGRGRWAAPSRLSSGTGRQQAARRGTAAIGPNGRLFKRC